MSSAVSKLALGLVLGLLAAMGACSTSGETLLGERPVVDADPVPVDPYRLPGPVRTTFMRQAAGSPLAATSHRTIDGRTVYQAYTTTGGKTYQLVADEDGTLLSMRSTDYPSERPR